MKTPTANQAAIDLHKKLIRLQNRARKLDIEINDVQQKMLLVCEHPDIEIQHDYLGGSYFDRCTYINKYICKFCGKIVHEERILGGYN